MFANFQPQMEGWASSWSGAGRIFRSTGARNAEEEMYMGEEWRAHLGVPA